MELRNVFKVGAFGLLLAAAGGCYEYPPPPAATMGDTYTCLLYTSDAADEP